MTISSYPIDMVRTRRVHKKRKTRRVQKTRRIKGGVDDEASDHIRLILQDLFPELDVKRFAITETDEYYRVNLIRCEEQARHSQRYSPRISIYKDGRMHIERLTSCQPVSGPEMIRRYILLARQLGLQSITLDDESEVYFPRSRYGEERCAIYLPILRILQKGQSWYESLGFVSSTTEAERAQNEAIRQMPFGSFVERLVQKERQEERERILRRYELNNNTTQQNKALSNLEAKPSALEGLRETFPEIGEDTPVYLALQQMVDRVNSTENACESREFLMLRKVIETCIATKKPLITYRTKKLKLTL